MMPSCTGSCLGRPSCLFASQSKPSLRSSPHGTVILSSLRIVEEVLVQAIRWDRDNGRETCDTVLFFGTLNPPCKLDVRVRDYLRRLGRAGCRL